MVERELVWVNRYRTRPGNEVTLNGKDRETLQQLGNLPKEKP